MIPWSFLVFITLLSEEEPSLYFPGFSLPLLRSLIELHFFWSVLCSSALAAVSSQQLLHSAAS